MNNNYTRFLKDGNCKDRCPAPLMVEPEHDPFLDDPVTGPSVLASQTKMHVSIVSITLHIFTTFINCNTINNCDVLKPDGCNPCTHRSDVALFG